MSLFLGLNQTFGKKSDFFFFLLAEYCPVIRHRHTISQTKATGQLEGMRGVMTLCSSGRARVSWDLGGATGSDLPGAHPDDPMQPHSTRHPDSSLGQEGACTYEDLAGPMI